MQWYLKRIEYPFFVEKMDSSENKKQANPYVLKLAARIKSLRIRKGYSNYEFFAYDHDISRSQFGRYEKGEDIRFSSLVKIAQAFDMTLEEFFHEGFD